VGDEVGLLPNIRSSIICSVSVYVGSADGSEEGDSEGDEVGLLPNMRSSINGNVPVYVGTEVGDFDSTGGSVSSILTGALVGYSHPIGSTYRRGVGSSVGTMEGSSVSAGKTQMKGEIVSAGVGAGVGKLKG
jgi:hypothetical protein